MVVASGQHPKEEYMKKYLASAATVAILTVAVVSTGHAWGISGAFKKTSNTSQRSGRDSVSQGKNSAGRDRYDYKNSFNRTNSPDVKGNANNANFGTMSTGAVGAAQVAAGSNTYGAAGKNGRVNMNRFGANNSGTIGSGGNTAVGGTSGSINLGDTNTNFVGDSAVKTASGQ